MVVADNRPWLISSDQQRETQPTPGHERVDRAINSSNSSGIFYTASPPSCWITWASVLSRPRYLRSQEPGLGNGCVAAHCNLSMGVKPFGSLITPHDGIGIALPIENPEPKPIGD